MLFLEEGISNGEHDPDRVWFLIRTAGPRGRTSRGEIDWPEVRLIFITGIVDHSSEPKAANFTFR
jgi:hypothetical protein